MASSVGKFAAAVIALALSALCQWFGSGLDPIWCLAWIAPVPLMVAAPRLGPWTAFAVAAIAHGIGDLNTWKYASIIPLPFHLLIVIAPAAAWGGSIVLFRRLARMGRPVGALLAVPVAWTGFAYLWELASPHGTFFDLAYTQMNFLPIIQIAAVTGLLGIGFCLLLASSAASLLLVRGTAGESAAAVSMATVLLAVVIGYGARRANSKPPSARVTIGLLASDAPGNLGARTPEASLKLFRTYLAQVPGLVAKGARVVVMPEHLGAFVDEAHGGNASQLDTLFGEAAQESGIYILVGVDALETNGVSRNQSRIYSPDGRLAGIYNKHHLLPGYESVFSPGTQTTVVATPEGRWGLEICKDLDFPALSREYGRAAVGLMLVPALDFGVDGWLHSRMAVLRGVESGFSVARSAAFGRLTLTDDRGRVLGEADAQSAPFAELVAPIPVRHDPTLFDRFGNWFAWLDLAALVCLMVFQAAPPARIQ